MDLESTCTEKVAAPDALVLDTENTRNDGDNVDVIKETKERDDLHAEAKMDCEVAVAMLSQDSVQELADVDLNGDVEATKGISDDDVAKKSNTSRIESGVTKLTIEEVVDGSVLGDGNKTLCDTEKSKIDEGVEPRTETMNVVEGEAAKRAEYKFDAFIQITGAFEEFKTANDKESFLKGCKWSPDGTCLLTNSEDKALRLFDLPKELYGIQTWPKDKALAEMKPSLKVDEGGLVYDYSWFPLMNSWDPVSCCFITSPSEEPVHLRDAFTGKLRASYRSYNYADELTSAYSVSFNPSGEKLYCGFQNVIKVFDTINPGRKSTSVNIKGISGQAGIISCIAFNPAVPTVYAVGTYQKEVGLYCEDANSGICVFKGHSGGLTHVMFSPDGNRLYTGGRKDQEIVCWDVRNPGSVLFSLCRTVSTNQRIYFDLTRDGKTLLTGNTDGVVGMWNVNDFVSPQDDDPLEAQKAFRAHKDCCNGISTNPYFPVLATSSGQRHVPDLVSDDDEDDMEGQSDTSDGRSVRLFDENSFRKKREDSVKLWWVGEIC